MSAKDRLGAMMMMAMSIATMPIHTCRHSPAPQTERPRPNGLKRYVIDGVEVWALNEKNARRKVAKKSKV